MQKSTTETNTNISLIFSIETPSLGTILLLLDTLEDH